MQTVSVLFVGADLSVDLKQPRAGGPANRDTLDALPFIPLKQRRNPSGENESAPNDSNRVRPCE